MPQTLKHPVVCYTLSITLGAVMEETDGRRTDGRTGGRGECLPACLNAFSRVKATAAAAPKKGKGMQRRGGDQVSP